MLPLAIIPQPALDVLESILTFWHDLFGGGENSWGFAIILLTFTIRLFILPLTFKSVKSMQALQVLQPEMKKIQERYKDDKQRLNQEMMKFYQENKVNPLGSCLPLLLQIPFFIALFELLRSDKFKQDIAGDESFFFIPDLADKLTGEPVVLGFMIVLYVGTQLAASLITMVGGDKNQQRIMLALPFVFVPFIATFEAGLILYWVTTNFWTVGQQLVVRKLYPEPGWSRRRSRRPSGWRPKQGARRPARGRRRRQRQASGRPPRRRPKSPRKKKKRSGPARGSPLRAMGAWTSGRPPTIRPRGCATSSSGWSTSSACEAEVGSPSPRRSSATVEGEDLGLLIGKHGDDDRRAAAPGHAGRPARRPGRPPARRGRRRGVPRATRERTPARGRPRGRRRAAYGRPVELEPMRAPERKVVHTYLSERTDIETYSEGDEPDRRLVVAPLRPAAAPERFT